MDLIKSLPSSPNKTGWPWSVEVSGDVYKSKSDWPKISIVTPSYNQGEFIEETIRSILLQNYPNLEYIIIDGGSTDNTVEVIKKYQPWITYWVSEPDKGQANAINKGLEKSTGQIFNWINSDDYLSPNALQVIAEAFETNLDVFAGAVNNFKEIQEGNNQDGLIGKVPNSDLSLRGYFLDWKFYFHQPGVWLSMEIIKDIKLNENLNYCFDTELILVILAKKPKIVYSGTELVNFRLHNFSKTISQYSKFQNDLDVIHQKFANHADPEIASMAKTYLQNKLWMKELKDLEKSSNSKTNKIGHVIAGIFKNPTLRLNRFTMGTIRKIIFK